MSTFQVAASYVSKTLRAMIRNRYLLITVLAGLVIGIGLLGSAAGYLSHKYRSGPLHTLAVAVENQLRDFYAIPNVTAKDGATIESIFLRLKTEFIEVPSVDDSLGGALSTWNDQLLILHRSGSVYLYDDTKKIEATNIQAPNNGLADYIELSGLDEFKNYTHNFKRFRFNDIQFVDSPALYGLALSYTFFDRERICYGNRVSWVPVPREVKDARALAIDADSWETIYESQPCLPLNTDWVALDGMMAGGRLALIGPTTLALTNGDFHLDGVHAQAVGVQSDAVDYGKVVAIDIMTRDSRHLAKGLRNPQGIAVDRLGRIWTTEHGMRGGDELNLIKDGANYGWPLETLGTLYNGQPFPTPGPEGRHEIFTAPVFAWLPSQGISSLMTIENFHPTWDGDLLAGSLASGDRGLSLFRIRIKDERVVFTERIRLGKRIRYVTNFGQGKIALWLDGSELMILSIAERQDPLTVVSSRLETKFGAELTANVNTILQSCNQCHSYEPNNNEQSPSLYAVMGRLVGGSSYGFYSEQLKSKNEVWTDTSLRAYLLDPEGFAPGTSMPDPDLQDDETLDALIWALNQLKSEDL